MITKYKDGASIQQIGLSAILRSKYGKFTNERRLLNNIVHSADIDVRSNNKYRDISHNYDEIVEVFLNRLSNYYKRPELKNIRKSSSYRTSKSFKSSKSSTSKKKVRLTKRKSIKKNKKN